MRQDYSFDWDGKPVPPEKWGRDHWSTLAYVETRCVDHDGYLQPQHMRGHCNSWHDAPTRLSDGSDLYGHNDYHCLADAVHHGLLTGGRATCKSPYYLTEEDVDELARMGLKPAPGNLLGRRDGFRYLLTHRYELTPKGLRVCAAIRAHKANGGSFSDFCIVIHPGCLEVYA